VIDVLELPALLGAQACIALCAELAAAAAVPATLLDGGAGRYAPLTRRAARVAAGADTRMRVDALLQAQRPGLAAYFGQPLGEIEEVQFLRYAEGDFFVAHQDGNTPLIRDASLQRRVSVVLFLNPQAAQPRPGCYGGGELVFHARPGAEPAQRVFAPAAGSLLAFRAETTHEVLPVTHGLRFTLASWYRAPPD
jgi:SM-20-related protein